MERNESDETPVMTGEERERRGEARRLNRRQLLAGGGVSAAAATGVAGFFIGRDSDLFESSETNAGASTNATTNTLPNSVQFAEVPNTPDSAPDPSILRFFTPHEALTVDALTSRILPGTTDDPGAHEAGVVTYIDNFLAERDGFPEPTYRAAPYAETYQGDAPPATPTPFTTVMVAGDQVERYGYQSMLTPPEVYRVGVAAVDRYANTTFGKQFIALRADQQDQIVGDLANGKATEFDKDLTGTAFFKNLRRHTGEGMFSDPLYGGNRNLVGWKLVGHPGAQRAYSPDEIRNPNFSRAPQSIADMMPFMTGMSKDPNEILPVSGSTEQNGGQ